MKSNEAVRQMKLLEESGGKWKEHFEKMNIQNINS